MRCCTRLFGFIATTNGALRAPPSIAASLHASYSTPKNIYHRSVSSHSSLLIHRENTAKITVWQKIRQSIPLLLLFNRVTAGGAVNLHATQFRLKQRKVSSHPNSMICPFPISPSLIPSSPNPPSRFLGQFDY